VDPDNAPEREDIERAGLHYWQGRNPLVDYADLDGNILTSNDPFDGVKVKDGMLVLPEGPGLGVMLKE